MATTVRDIAGQPSVGRTALLQMTVNTFYKPNYDRFVAFCRAIKVFQKCFLHYKSFNLNAYNPKLNEFHQTMADLYELQSDPRAQDLSAVMPTIEQEVINEAILMSVGVTELNARESLTHAVVVVKFGHIQHQSNREIWHLGVSTITQNSCFSNLTISWSDLDYAVQNDRQIEITYTDSVIVYDFREYQPFNISYRQLHHEGFHQRITFGETRLLFCIEFASNEQNYNQLIVNDFHLHSIIYALKRRINHLRGQPSVDQNYRHPDSDIQRRVNYEVGQVDPTTTDAFWGQTPDVSQNRAYCRLKYTDLQIGFQLGEELTHQKLCTCNEFCNMNAFFHYNPIYRFLLVEHNRHYIKNKTIVPNLYQMAITFTATPTPNVPFQLTPVFDWFNSVSERLTENHLIFHKKPGLKTFWTNSTPSAIDMEASVYITMFRINLGEIMYATYAPVNFDEQAFVNIDNCMERLYELHRRIEDHKHLVVKRRRDQWTREFEYRSRILYYNYLNQCLASTLADVNIDYEEKLFTTDCEVKGVAITRAQIKQFNKWRKIEHNSYPQNITFVIKGFTYAINQLWFSFTRFEPMSVLYTSTAINEEYNSLKAIHNQINQTLLLPQFVGHRTQMEPTSLQALQGQGFSQNTQNLFIQFYKLKVYSRVFKIQNKYLKTHFRYTYTSGSFEQGFTNFEGIWNDFWIEDMSSHIPQIGVTNIFQKNHTFITLINDFYNNIWLPPEHDIPGHTATPIEIQDSMFKEYTKRRVWDRIDGDNRQVFHNIIESFDESLRQLVTQSNDFIDNHIMLAMNDIRDHYRDGETELTEDDKNYCIILDVVMYWLFRATLYQITGTVAALLRTIDGLHSNDLVIVNTQYFLSKPGLVKFFLTRDLVFKKLDDLYTRSIVYSSPFDNMMNAFRETQYNIKMLYNEFFRKLVEDWYSELDGFFTNPLNGWFTMVKLHVIAGASFIISYIDHSRKRASRMRKKLNTLYNNPQYFAISTHFPFIMIWEMCRNWFRNIDPQELDHPFAINPWQTLLDQEYNQMDAVDLSQLTNAAGPLIQPIT